MVLEDIKKQVKLYENEKAKLDTKYESISLERLESLFNMVKSEKHREYLSCNIEALVELAFTRVYLDEDIITAYISINDNSHMNTSITVEEAKELSEQVLSDDYYVFNDIVFYRNKEELVDLAKIVLDKRLSSEDSDAFISKYFSEKKLIEDKTKEQLIYDLIVKNDLEVLLGILPAIAYINSDDIVIYYACLESCID